MDPFPVRKYSWCYQTNGIKKEATHKSYWKSHYSRWNSWHNPNWNIFLPVEKTIEQYYNKKSAGTTQEQIISSIFPSTQVTSWEQLGLWSTVRYSIRRALPPSVPASRSNTAGKGTEGKHYVPKHVKNLLCNVSLVSTWRTMGNHRHGFFVMLRKKLKLLSPFSSALSL